MHSPDHETIREWLDLLADGALEADRQAAVERHLAACDDCRAESRLLMRLGERLADGRIAVRPGFSRDVLATLPPAGWENRHPSTWGWAVALLALLAGGSLALTRLGAGGVETGSPLAGAFVSLAQLFKASLLAGAGLLTASWRGVGMGISALLEGSPMTIAAFTLLVVCLDLLLIRLLRRPRRRAPAAVGRAAPGEERD